MQEESSDFDNRPAIGKSLLEEVGYKSFIYARKQSERLEKKLYSKIDKYIEERVRPFKDIGENPNEVKQRLFQTLKDQWITSFEMDISTYEESLGDTTDKERRMNRKFIGAEREVNDIDEFQLDRALEKELRDIRSEKDKEA